MSADLNSVIGKMCLPERSPWGESGDDVSEMWMVFPVVLTLLECGGSPVEGPGVATVNKKVLRHLPNNYS